MIHLADDRILRYKLFCKDAFRCAPENNSINTDFDNS